jgi:hypothetical protein
MNWIKKKFYWMLGERNAFPRTKHIIKYAFTSGGIRYYQFDDAFNIPWQRGIEATHVYEELQMRCDRDYLLEHTKLVDAILTGNRITMVEWQRLKAANDQMRQRLDWVVLPDLAYKLASVVYFDASENPDTYEMGYARKKIALWKANEDVDAFFLRQPLRELMPFLSGFEGSFKVYSALVEKVNKHHLNNLFTQFSGVEGSKATETQ